MLNALNTGLANEKATPGFNKYVFDKVSILGKLAHTIRQNKTFNLLFSV